MSVGILLTSLVVVGVLSWRIESIELEHALLLGLFSVAFGFFFPRTLSRPRLPRLPEMQTLFLFLGTFVLYAWDPACLNGDWILDDKGTITMNPVVKGQVPWSEVWHRDYWGHDQLQAPSSHKSWRPITTASYRINYEWGGDPSFWFHVVDRLLHALVAAFALPVANLCLGLTTAGRSRRSPREDRPEAWENQWLGFVVALLFATHPIHVESVSNTTGRAEVLCGLFYMLGFLAYSVAVFPECHLSPRKPGALKVVGSTIFGVVSMLVMSICAMLCKEHGITLPLTCLVWDAYIGTNTSVQELFDAWGLIPPVGAGSITGSSTGSSSALTPPPRGNKQKGGSPPPQQQPGEDSGSREGGPREGLQQQQRVRRYLCWVFLWRVILVALGTAAIAFWRVQRNGTAPPDFACEQNPTACNGSRWVRFLTSPPPSCCPI